MKGLIIPTIYTQRLVLRKYELKDYRSCFKNYLSDPQVSKFMHWETYKSKWSVIKFIKNCKKIYKLNNQDYFWAIELNESHEIIGGISSKKQDGVLSLNDCGGKTVFDIGYSIGSKWWGKGIVAEAGNAVINYLFNNSIADLIFAKHDELNPNSGKVMRKLGMAEIAIKHEPSVKNSVKMTNFHFYLIKKTDFKC